MVQVVGDSPNDDAVVGRAAVSGKSGVFGYNPAAGGNGVAGISVDGNGLYAKSTSLNGVYGESVAGSGVNGHSSNQIGVYGSSDTGDGIQGVANAAAHSGVFGRNTFTGDAIAPGGNGVFGLTVAAKGAGVFGANNHATSGVGVQGNGPEAGLSGFSEAGSGVLAHSNQGDGTQSFAHSSDHNGLLGMNDAKAEASPGGAPKGNGVYGYTDVPNGSGICGAVGAGNTTGAGVTGIGPIAGRFFGNVVVSGDIQFLNADYAEDFDLSDPDGAEPGSVMVLDDGASLRRSRRPYDGRVAGVVCGAGTFRPAVILDRRDDATEPRVTVALMGKVYCKVDASYGQVRAGDLLTTSATPGHAMRATDRGLAFGAILGKALAGLDGGRALVPILVTLQ